LRLAIDGRLDSDGTGQIWREATDSVAAARAASVVLDAAGVDYCDGSGIALLLRQE
jgi:phospholipid/cholesterol/gamma-HCH transport system permease protein